jgi:septum formation protein
MTDEITPETLILASSSPRRKMLMRQAGLACSIVHPPIHEPDDIHDELSPAGQAEAIAYFKACSVGQLYADRPVLGADTIVAVGGHILGKAPGPEQAAEMLAKLSGTRHEVITGVALLGPGHWRMIASSTTHVTMRTITPDEINGYVESGEWRGKAGSYAIQETGDRFVVKVDGSLSNVVGLPMELVAKMLEAFDNREQPCCGGV